MTPDGRRPDPVPTPDEYPMVDISDLSLSLGGQQILSDVSLSVERGEVVGLIGPNGAGKTTLLRALTGVLTPDAGTVVVDGETVHALSSRATSRLLSVVPQETTVSFAFDVRSIVEMGRTPYRSRFSPPTADDRKLIEDALERTATDSLAERSIGTVSGGERQRVLLARTLAQDTPVIVLDEPTASLDIAHQVETLELVCDLAAEGKTVIAAIHDLDLAARYCDSLVLLADGTVLERGPPETVLTSAHLERAFDATAAITKHPVTGSTNVTTLPSDSVAFDTREGGPPRVHVVGSGGTAAGVLARLAAAGVDASLGPVTATDVAAETAAQLGVDTLTVDPFSPLERTTVDALERELAAADVTILADLRVSVGNQLLLESLADAPAPVFLETTPFTERNAAGGGARERYERLRDRARAVSDDSDSLVRTVRRVLETRPPSPPADGSRESTHASLDSIDATD
ncbi:heme ABC transporter ATP-binding protein [Natronobiforma cellulositropha]|uniref:heme ABC transporter ATP-binding protein n=1 Tax=Natronobiforma cellulositropha TaxID=1679076 RepID=UPI0021D5F6D9|nr:heme ABC transporter ATP-binding protein [Natronobiforma cellulositropha]